MKVFASLLTYGLGKVYGIGAAARRLARQVSHPEEFDPDDLLPCVHVVQMLRDFGEVIVYHGASTSLPKARSRAAHAFLESDADLWVMVDDDVETDLDTLRRLVQIASGDHNYVAVLPCCLRGVGDERLTLNIVWDSLLVLQRAGVQTRAVRRGGCGLMVVPRQSVEALNAANKHLEYTDADNVKRIALFSPVFVCDDEGPPRVMSWLGEDYSFCERLRDSGSLILAPVEGFAVHDGQVIKLEESCLPPTLRGL